MQTQILPKPPVSSQRRYVTVTIVVALHLVAIYGLLLALSKPIMIPTPTGPITVDLFHNKPPVQPPAINPVLQQVHGNIDVVPPTVRIDNGSPPNAIVPANPGQQDIGPIVPTRLPTLSPPLAIASTHTIPIYPSIGIRLNEEGSVTLALNIDERGNVVDARMIRSSGYEALDVAAVAWVKAHWRYQPALRDGVPIPSSTTATVTFRLTGRAG